MSKPHCFALMDIHLKSFPIQPPPCKSYCKKEECSFYEMCVGATNRSREETWKKVWMKYIERRERDGTWLKKGIF